MLKEELTSEAVDRAWRIVKTHGKGSLARFALLDDKRFFFSANSSLISYVVKNRVALVLGDPIGPIEDLLASISEFKDYCVKNRWFTAFYQAVPSCLETYSALGFNSLMIGKEAIVDVRRFTLEGSSNKTLRNSYNKLVRLGYRSEMLEPPHSAHMMRELKEISNDWLLRRGASEIRFLGWFDDAYINSSRILIARDREGILEAFLNLIPEFQANEIVVDLMRQRRQTESGLMDFLFVSLFRWGMENGYSTINIGLSALAGIEDDTNASFIERALNYVYQHSRSHNFRGLFAFKQKFHPAWSPRYLVYPGAVSLPLVGLSILQAVDANWMRNLYRRVRR